MKKPETLTPAGSITVGSNSNLKAGITYLGIGTTA